ncbi:hypothetical protein ACFW04_004824 [Cataglyphis niger]
MCLRSTLPLMITDFNPRDPPTLISGLMSGQACNWDIRIGNRPVQMYICEREVPRDLHPSAEIIDQNLDVLDFDVWLPDSQISSERNAAKPRKR